MCEGNDRIVGLAYRVVRTALRIVGLAYRVVDRAYRIVGAALRVVRLAYRVVGAALSVVGGEWGIAIALWTGIDRQVILLRK